MSSRISLVGKLRESKGSSSARRLRREGFIPAIIYGADKEPVAISVEEKEATKYYRKGGFFSSVTEIEIDGKKHLVVAKSVQLDLITDLVSHVDFINLNKDTQKVDVPINFAGIERSTGVKLGGFFNIINRKVALLCPANNIPPKIDMDVSKMRVGEVLKTSNLKLPQDCKLVGKELNIASIIGSRGSNSADEQATEEASTEEAAAGE